MSVTSASAVLSIAPQAGSLRDAAFAPTNFQWYRMRAMSVSVGPQQAQEQHPQEVGGDIIPLGSFKSAAAYGGDVEIIPRLQASLGYLLMAATGKTTTVADTAWVDGAEVSRTGVHLHKFTYAADQRYIPWVAVRRSVPGQTTADTYGDIGFDAKVNNINITVPQAGLIRFGVGFQGRKMIYPSPTDVNAWSYANSYEDTFSVPHAGKGEVKIAGKKYPIVQFSVSLANNLSSMQEEQIVGSYFMDDITTKNRAAQLRIVVKWNNADLYKRALTGSIDGVDWNSLPFYEVTQGAAKAIEGRFESPYNIVGVSPVTPYMLRFFANQVIWQIDRQGIELAGNNLIYVPFVGTVVKPTSGEYLELWVQNDTASYTWPSAPTFSGLPSPVAFTEGGGAVDLGTGATVASSFANFNSGTVTVDFLQNGSSDDTLSVKDEGAGPTNITLTGNNVFYNAVQIGVKSGGTAGSKLTITLDSDATPTAVQKLVRCLTFNNLSATPSTEPRLVEVGVHDGRGGWTFQRQTVNVTAV
jgi:hypothetical protein